MLEIINQVFAIKVKADKNDNTLFNRNLDRIQHEFEALGYQIINPFGKVYKNEMTDVEANVTGSLNSNSKITKVLKPIVYFQNNEGDIKLMQKGIVIVD